MEVAMRIMVKLLVLAASGTLTATVHAGQGQAAIRIESVAHGTSTPLNAHAPMLPGWQPGSQPYVVRFPKRPGNGGGGGGNTGGGGSWSDPVLQTSHITQSFLTGTVFQGQGFTGALPPDTNLAVGGPVGNTQIAQAVNTSLAIYSTSGSLLFSGDLGLSLFAGLQSSSNCYANDGGDPIVLWDQLDQRWIISQLAYNSTFSQNDYCLAISLTADALGNYAVFDFSFGGDVPDYPKLGIWSDGIYFSANMFKISVNQHTGLTRSSFLGAQACSFPRSSGYRINLLRIRQHRDLQHSAGQPRRHHVATSGIGLLSAVRHQPQHNFRESTCALPIAGWKPGITWEPDGGYISRGMRRSYLHSTAWHHADS
jgi:hypothetical protein